MTMFTNLEVCQISVDQIYQQVIVQTEVKGLMVHKLEWTTNNSTSLTAHTYMYNTLLLVQSQSFLPTDHGSEGKHFAFVCIQ